MGKLFNLLTMFGPLRAAKFWVALVMAFIQFANIYMGLDIGLDQETATAIITGIGATLVWLVPNAKPSLTEYTDAEILEMNNRATGHNQTHIPTRGR